MSELPVLDPIDQRIPVSLLEKQTTVPASYAPACVQAAEKSQPEAVTRLILRAVEETSRSQP